MSGRGRQDIVAGILEAGVVAVVRLPDARAGRAVAEALCAGGVRAIEITMTVPRAVDLIAELAEALAGDVIIGAGTVLDPITAADVIEAGAEFVVSPVFRVPVLDACHARNVACMPGCFTPTEILGAWDAGADVVKVFPATALGPGFFSDLRGPLPQVRMMPTGGVTRDNAGAWIGAGAVAIGVGTALVDSGAVREGRFDVITANARHFVTAVADARRSGGAAIGTAGPGRAGG